MANEKVVQVLLVEDHRADIVLTQRAFRKGNIANNLSVVLDGVEAMQFLHQQGRYQNAPRPDLVLLDLNMPRKNGQEVLKEMKSDPSLKLIPVIILTTSNDEKDVVESYGLHANAYIVKPVDFDKFQEALSTLGDFWFNVVRLPQ